MRISDSVVDLLWLQLLAQILNMTAWLQLLVKKCPVTGYSRLPICAIFWQCVESGSAVALAPAVGADSHYGGCSGCCYSFWRRSVLGPVTNSFTI